MGNTDLPPILAQAPSQDETQRPVTLADPRSQVIWDRLEAAREPQAPAAQAPTDQADARWERLEDEARQRDVALMRSFTQAAQTDPEKAADAHRLGIELGTDPAIVEANVGKARQALQEKQLAQLLRASGSRRLKNVLLNPQFLRVARDDLKNLQDHQRSISIGDFALAGQLESELGFLHNKTMQGTATEKDRDRIASIQQQMEKLPGSSAGYGISSLFYGSARLLGQMTETVPQALAAGTAMAGVALVAGQAGPQAAIPEEILSIPGMFAAGFGGMMAGSTAAIEGGFIYDELIQLGVSHTEAKRVAEIGGAINGLLEVVGIGVVTAPFRRELRGALSKEVAAAMVKQATKGGGFARAGMSYLTGVGGETLTEAMQEVTSYLAENNAILNSNPLQLDEQKLRDRPELGQRVSEIIGETLRGMALLGLPGPLVQLRGEVARAQRMQASQMSIEGLRDAGDKSKVRERAPDLYEMFLGAITNDTDIQNVYFTHEDFTKRMEQVGLTREQLKQLAPEVHAQLIEAEEAGTLEIPTAGFGSKFLSSDFGRSLAQDVRAEPEGPSPVEHAAASKEAADNIAANSLKILSEKAEIDKEFVASANRVRDAFAAQLQAVSTKRKKPWSKGDIATIATFYRDFIVTRANAGNVSPEEYATRRRITATDAEGLEGLKKGASLQQGELAGFVLNKSDAAEGRQLVELNVGALDAEFAKQEGNYIGPGGKGQVKARYQQFEEFQKTGVPIEAPTIGFSDSGVPMFDNGRHRFAVMRDQGKKVFAAMLPQDIEKARAKGLLAEVDTAEQMIGDLERDVTQHQLTVQRGARKTADVTRLSATEKAAVRKAAKKAGVTMKAIEDRVREQKTMFPVEDGWAKLEFDGITYDAKTGKWAPKYKAIPYTFNRDSKGKALKPGSKPYKAMIGALGERLADIVRGIKSRADNGDPDAAKIIRQAGWYREMRKRLRQEFGGLGDLFADLLGATSPNTPVRDNWAYAVEVLSRATKGDFDALMPQWEAWAAEVERIETEFGAWFNDQVAQGKTKKAIAKSAEYKQRKDAASAARELPDDLNPRKESGAKYGFNGRNIVRALLDLWRTVKEANPDIGRGGTAPKALNFSGNLIGFRPRATIDVWAARLLQRIAGKIRLPVLAEQSVGGKMLPSGETTLAFGFGQDVFSAAVKAIRSDPDLAKNKLLRLINDDDLQAIVWFAEKEVWTVNNWTGTAGEGGSFEFEADLQGQADVDQVKALRKVADSKLSSKADREAALAQLQEMQRTVDRFQGMISLQRSAGTQGVDYVPTDADQAQLQERLHTATVLSDPEGLVVANKVVSTVGLYGDPERAIDLELVTKEGFDPSELWLRMLEEGLAADQDATILSRVLRVGEAIDYRHHRPGVEVYFREAGTLDTIKPILDGLQKQGVLGYTVIVDGRRNPAGVSGKMPPVVGVRFQFVPEMEERWGGEWSTLSETEMAAKVEAKGEEMLAQAAKILTNVEGVTFAGRFWYETQVAFRHQYQGIIDALSSRSTGKVDSEARGERGWRGQPVAAGVADAATRRVEAEAQSAERAARERQVPAAVDRPGLGQNEVGQPGQRGEFFPDALLIAIYEGGDLTTVLHELSHFFFAAMVEDSLLPGADKQTIEDVETLLRWFAEASDGNLAIDTGSFDLIQQWRALPIEEQRAYHEQLAYNFELYLFDGRAPTVKLQRVFDRMRRFFLRVYDSIRTQLNRAYKSEFGRDLPVLTPEVRQVFDRMIAAREAVAEAESMRHMLPMFTTRDEFVDAGFRPEDWDTYTAMLQEARDAAEVELGSASLRQLRWLKGARDRAMKDLKRQANRVRANVEDQITEEVKAELPYVARDLLTNAPKEGKMDLGSVMRVLTTGDLQGQEIEAAIRKLDGMLVTKGGLDAEMVAETIGVQGGARELVGMLVSMRDLEVEVEQRTDATMVREYGELVTPKQMEFAIDKALHNDARSRFVEVELRFLRGITKPARQVRAAAKFTARRLVEQRQFKDVRSSTYSSAEARFAREAEKAMKAKDYEAAVEAKEKQLLNHYMAKEAIKIREEIEKAKRGFRALFQTDKKLATKYQLDFVHAARWILSQFGMATKTQVQKTESYLSELKKIDPDLHDELTPMLMDAAKLRGDWKNMRVVDMRKVIDMVEALWLRARQAKQIQIGEKKVEIDAAVETLLTGLGESPDLVEGETGALTDKQRNVRDAAGLKAVLTKVEHYLRRLGQPFLELLHDPARNAMNEYRMLSAQFTKRAVEALRELHDNNLLPPGKIMSKELNYQFGNGNRGNGMAEVIGLLLHWGNRSNKEKMAVAGRGEGNRWAAVNIEDKTVDLSRVQAFIDRLIKEGILTEAHFDFVQEVWDTMDAMWPMMQRAHREIRGRLVERVDNEAFTVTFKDGTQKTYRGGYVPARGDPDLNPGLREISMEQLTQEQLRAMPRTPSGFMEARIHEYRERPLALDVNMVVGHIDEAMRFAIVQPRVNDVLKVINNKTLKTKWERIDREAFQGLIYPWLERMTTQRLYQGGKSRVVDRLFKFVRRNTGVAIMFGNVVNSAQQITGLSNAAKYVETRRLLHALGRISKERRVLFDWIEEQSTFMSDRLSNQVFGLRNDLDMMLVDPSKAHSLELWTTRNAYWLQGKMQAFVDGVTWLGAYDQHSQVRLDGETEAEAHARAVTEADRAVRLSQGSFNPEDLADYERTSPFVRSWFQFTSYFNTVWNQLFVDQTSWSDRVRVSVQSFLLPMIMAEVIAKTLRGTWDDEDDDGYVDEAMEVLVGAPLSGAFAMIPVAGSFIGSAIRTTFFDNNAYGDRIITSPSMSTLARSVYGVLTAVQRVGSGEGLSKGVARDFAMALSVLGKHPAMRLIGPAARPGAYLWDVATGDAKPQNPIDFLFGLSSGRASEASKR
jgi:hypothetical protein